MPNYTEEATVKIEPVHKPEWVVTMTLTLQQAKLIHETLGPLAGEVAYSIYSPLEDAIEAHEA